MLYMTNGEPVCEAAMDVKMIATQIVLNTAQEWHSLVRGTTPNGVSHSLVDTPEKRGAMLDDIRRFFASQWAESLCEAIGVHPERMMDRLETEYEASALCATLEGGERNENNERGAPDGHRADRAGV